MVIGLPKINFSKGFSQGFILGKHPEHNFEKDSHERTFAPLELIHSDVFGPFPHMLMSQAKYALRIIDDFSRYCWVYFLKHKSEVFGLFKSLSLWLKTSMGGNSRSSDMIMVVSISSLSLFNIV